MTSEERLEAYREAKKKFDHEFDIQARVAANSRTDIFEQAKRLTLLDSASEILEQKIYFLEIERDKEKREEQIAQARIEAVGREVAPIIPPHDPEALEAKTIGM